MIFLGTGASQLIPNPFCDCRVCRYARQANDPREVRRRSALLLDAHTLIDAGPDVPAACNAYGKSLTELKSLFITHMGSIGMPAVNHHIYNFGTTSLFLSLGSVERQTVIGSDGKAARKRYLPIGITADERICAGAMYARMVNRMMHYLNNPELLEAPPETVRFEEGNAYGLAATKVSRRLRKKQQQTLAG